MNKSKLIQGSAEKRKANSNSTYDGSLAFEPTELFDGLADVDNVKEVLAEKERLEQELDELKQETEEVKQEIAAIKEKAIVPQEDATLGYGRLKMSATGLIDTLPDDMSEQDILETLRTLRRVNEAVQWTVGDVINQAFSKWGEKYSYYAKVTEFSEKTLREYAYVARSIPLSIRMDNLSFGHHQLVAGFKDKDGNVLDEKQRFWLDKAAKGDGEIDADGKEKTWSVARLRKEIINDKRGGILPSKNSETSKRHLKMMQSLTMLLDVDTISLPQAKRKDHLKNLETLRKLLDKVEAKLMDNEQQEKST